VPSTAPPLQGQAPQRLQAIGASIRRRRQQLGVSAVATAAAAGISRVTLHRIETGAASVTLGALMNVLDALDLCLADLDAAPAHDAAATEPELIELHSYPVLQQLSWHVQGSSALRPAEAAALYARRRRRREPDPLLPHELKLIRALEVATDGNDVPA
jgi:transcriptional regulator with XRE-family HTH domain